jgi:hypothetical protein
MATRSYVLATGANYLKVSDDQGLTWETITPSGYPSNLANITSIAASTFDPYKALITSSSEGLWSTTDGGVSFTQVPGTGGVSLYSVNYLDGVRIVAVGSEVYRSFNGGTSFTLTGVTPASLYGSSGPNIYFRNVHFGSNFIGFASIFDKIYKTYNTGLTWESTNSNAAIVAGKFVVGIIHLNDTNVVIALVEDSGVYVSLDGGISFSLSTATPVIDLNTSFISTAGQSAGTWIIDSNQDIYYSSGSGLGYTLVGNYPFGAPLEQAVFGFSGSNAIFIGAGITSASTTIHTTQNGGATLNEEANYTGIAKALSSTLDYECGECPGKSDFNPQTGFCEDTELAGPICPPGYIYDPVANTCTGQGAEGSIDIVVSRDNSGSVLSNSNYCSYTNGSEWGQMNAMLSDVVVGLSAGLSAGTTQIAVGDWSSCGAAGNQSTIVLGLTSNETSINNAICAARSYNGGTCQTIGLCAAYNELINGSTANPSAEKMLILVTDGKPRISDPCSVLPYPASSGIGDFADAENTRSLAEQIKQQGVRLVLVVLGEPDERQDVYDSLVQPIGNTYLSSQLTYPPVPSLDDNGNLLYFESDFTNSQALVQNIINSLTTEVTIPAPTCENCTIYVDPGDGTAYFQSNVQYDFIPCCYKLSSCDSATEIYSNTDLSQYDGQVVNIAGQEGCFSISQLSSVCIEDAQEVTVTTVYGSCETCLPSFKLYNCKDTNISIQTSNTQFEALLGKTVKLVEYPGDCWQVGPNSEKTLPLEPLTPSGEPFQTCIECDPKEYGLTNCVNGVSVASTVDLSAYVGKVIKADNFPGLCFTVEENPCDCLKITINGQVYNIDREQNLFNGKPYFQFITASQLSIVLAYDSNETRWEVYNPETQAIYFYSNLNIECPITSVWERVDPNFPGNITTEACPLPILNISVTEEFASCEPCVNC